MFVLKVVVEAEALGGEVLADDRHGEVGAALAAHAFGPGVAVVAGLVGDLAGFGEEFFPFVQGKPALVPIGAGPFAAVVEEADVVVAVLDRLDLGLDEGVELVEIGLQAGGKIEIHWRRSLGDGGI